MVEGMRLQGLAVTLGYLLVGASAAPVQGAPGMRVPTGFEVTEFADTRLANDIFCMTLDPKGRVVVSGLGYIRILVDDDNDGRADRAITVADGPKDGAQGMLWEGNWLYVTGDGGLRRYRVREDGQAQGPSKLIRAMKTGGEHAAHALRRGPDGWLYVLCGNTAGIDASFAQAAMSPIKNPVAGCVLRFSPDLKTSEIVADGFRNPYGMDFNADGELFTFDSDNERCVSLPWYEPTRLYHVIPGGHYGWQAPQRGDFWRMPPYFCDVVAPVGTFGRGSPTGVVCYRHTQFPKRYRDGLFLLDWTFGRIYFVRLDQAGASYTCHKEVFLQVEGDNGFAPTAIVVQPTTGDLFVSIGGRGTRGTVYRIRYRKGLGTPTRAATNGASNDEAAHHATTPGVRVKSTDAPERMHTLLALHRSANRHSSESLERAIRANWGYSDRYVRAAAARLIEQLDVSSRRRLAGLANTAFEQGTLGMASSHTDADGTLRRMCRLIEADETPGEARLDAVRVVQRTLGDLPGRGYRGTVFEGYAPRRKLEQRTASIEPVLGTLQKTFPTHNADLDRELSRTLAMLEAEDPAILRKVCRQITATSDPVEDIHYLIVLAQLRATRSPVVTAMTADALLALDRKIASHRLHRDNNWPLRIAELHTKLARKDPGLNSALLAHPEFGRPDHALFARAKGFDKQKAARIFLARARKEKEYAWNAALVDLVAMLPEQEARPVLHNLWGRAGLDSAILPYLARHPHGNDRDKFVQGLLSSQLETVRLCLRALQDLSGSANGTEVLALLRALQGVPETAEGARARDELVAYLCRCTGQGWSGADRQAWTDWFCKTYPDLGVRLINPDGVDVASWEKRLARVDWSHGNAARGQKVFLKANCASCHGGQQGLGPDLHCAGKRFSRADLFTAIIQPSRDVSPRYQTTLIETTAGKVYQGLIIYEAVDALILQTGPATTVRIPGNEIASRRISRTSLMPPGLLDALEDRDLADLYAYLRSP
jgi:putative membrane-bound dehydrogenase-like protein